METPPWRLKQKQGFQFENPFSLKVAQIFTGVGVGCGVGIGVGNPIYLGAIPALQQVMVATRGATDIFSGVGRHVNTSLKKLGVKNVQAGVGCGIGIGHGFGVGLALKPGVVRRIQSSFEDLVAKIMTKMKDVPGLSSAQSPMQGATQGQTTSAVQGATQGQTPSPSMSAIRSTSDVKESRRVPNERTGVISEFTGTHTEKVLATFLQNPLVQPEHDLGSSKMIRQMNCMATVLQLVVHFALISIENPASPNFDIEYPKQRYSGSPIYLKLCNLKNKSRLEGCGQRTTCFKCY